MVGGPSTIEYMSAWTWLFPHTSVSFASQLTPQQAAEALRAATSRRNFTAYGTIAGSVGSERVHLYHRTLIRNSFKPHFRGSLHATAQGCELRGSFAQPWLVKAFMVFWLGFCVLWSVLTAIQVGRVDLLLLLPAAIPGVLMLGFGIGLVRLGQHMANDDPATVSRMIRQALQSPSA